MAIDESWGRALRTAKRRYEERHDTDLTYKGMGAKLAELLGRDTPVPHPTVRSWFVDGQEPDTFAVVRALAAMLEVSVGELLADVPRDAEADPPSLQNEAAPSVRPDAAPDVNHSATTDLAGGAVRPVARPAAATRGNKGKRPPTGDRSGQAQPRGRPPRS